MATSPNIRTKRLLITPFSDKYLNSRYVSWLNNPYVTRFSEQRYKAHTIESCRKYWKSFENTPNYFWAISVIDSDPAYIGTINAYVDKMNKVADIGILIGETRAWGKGYATESFEVVFCFLFEMKNVRKVTAGTISPNKPMLKVMQRIGMFEDGVRKQHYIWNGTEVDIIHMAMFGDQWFNNLSTENRELK